MIKLLGIVKTCITYLQHFYHIVELYRSYYCIFVYGEYIRYYSLNNVFKFVFIFVNIFCHRIECLLLIKIF